MTDTTKRETENSKAETRRIPRPRRCLAALADSNINASEMTGPDVSRILRESK